MKKRILSILLTCIMVIGMLPAAVFAAPTDKVYVGGVELTNGQYLASSATTPSTTEPSGGYAYWDADTNTMTLKDYAYTGRGYDYCIIYAECELNIVLIGESTLEGDDESVDDGIHGTGTVTISGPGSLTITNTGDDGISGTDGVTIESGNITINSYYGIYSGDGAITLSGGTVDITAVDAALYCYENLFVNGGTITLKTTSAEEGDYAIYGCSSADMITIAAGLNVQASTNSDGSGLVEYDVDANDTYKYVKITPVSADIVIKKTDEEGNPLAGAEFQLATRDGGKSYTAESGEDGLATFTGVEPGYYELTETEAPAGYITSEATWAFYVNAKGYVTEYDPAIIGHNGNPYNNTDPHVVVNEKMPTVTIEIPFTKVVELGSNGVPGETTFEFELLVPNSGNEDELATMTVTGNTITVDNGADTYEGEIVITIPDRYFGNLQEGMVLREKNTAETDWTYDTTEYFILLDYANDSTTEAEFTQSYRVAELEDGYYVPANDTPVESLVFTNTYTHTEEVTKFEKDARILLHKMYKVEASASEGGTISKAGITKVLFRRDVKYTITPAEGYEIEAVYVDGKNVGAVDTYKFKSIGKDHTIHAVFTAVEG